MLHIFRHIRKQLMEQNKVKTYLLYAVGEVILVMIGILLALQVNNWNENRNDLQYESIMLQQISESIKNDMEGYEQHLERISMVQDAINFVMNTRSAKTSISDSVFTARASRLRLFVTPTLNTASYEALKSSGLERIKNAELRLSISNYYEVQLPRYLDGFNQDFFDNENQSIWLELIDSEAIITNIVEKGMNWEVEAFYDQQKMLNHPRFLHMIRNNITLNTIYKSLLYSMIEESEGLTLEIDTYLKN